MTCDAFRRRSRAAGIRRLLVAATLSAAAATTSARASVQSPARNTLDLQDLERLKKEKPRAVELLEKGEAALRAGELEDAVARFEAARNLAPGVALPARRSCQVLSLLGQTSQAKYTCMLAMDARGSAMDARASVGAWLSTPVPLSPAELDRVATLADRTRRLGSQKPWGPAAACDVARRIGHRGLLKECVTSLSELAPDHYETSRAKAAASISSAWPRRLGWAALVLLCVATLLRGALSRPLIRSRGARAAKVGAVGALVLLGALGRAPLAHADALSVDPNDPGAPLRPRGQLSQKFPIDLREPMKSLPSEEERNKDPLQFGYWLMDLAAIAENAIRKQQYPEAAKYFETIVAAVPDRPIGYSKLCQAYLGMNQRDRAVVPCKKALTFSGARVEDHLRNARLTISKEGELTPQEISDVDSQVKHLVGEKQEATAHRIACELATRLDDEERLESCVAGLTKAAPNELGTVSFEWALALKRDDPERARALMVRAAELGMTQQGLDKMRAGSDAMQPAWRKALRHWRHVLASLLVVSAAVILLVTRRRVMTGGRGALAKAP